MNSLAFLHQAVTFTSLRNTTKTLPLRTNGIPSTCPHHRRPRFIATAHEPTHPPTTTIQKQTPIDKYLQAGLGVVVLKRGKARLFRDGHNPMVYAGAVERHLAPQQHSPQQCHPVAVCDGALSCIGFGFFNPNSMFRVRLLRHVDPHVTNAEPGLPWNFAADIVERLESAVALRATIGIPNQGTDVYRVVNGDGDRLSGLVVDRVKDSLVVSTSALWCEVYKDTILQSLSTVMPECEDIIWRRSIDRLRQDGLVTEDNGSNGNGSAAEQNKEEGENSEVVVLEENVKYALPRFALTKGQKTGHYADQRENRLFVRRLLERRPEACRILDLFCYSGGFALNAALGNAQHEVVAVESSLRALDMARRNAELNGVADRVEFVHSDVVKFLRGQADGQGFDVVILDPPKFAPNAKSLARAVHKYRSLNAAAIRMVKRGGLLLTCTCSAAMTQDRGLFVETVRAAAAELGREISLVKVFGAAGDHPVTPEMTECEYLTMCVFVCK